jgi:hypothetical protein
MTGIKSGETDLAGSTVSPRVDVTRFGHRQACSTTYGNLDNWVDDLVIVTSFVRWKLGVRLICTGFWWEEHANGSGDTITILLLHLFSGRVVRGEAQLATIEPPRGKHTSIREQEKSVVLASADLYDAGIISELRRAQRRNKSWGPNNSLILGFNPKLTILVQTPSVYVTFGVHSKAMEKASTHRHNLSEVKGVGTSGVQKAAFHYLTAKLT